MFSHTALELLCSNEKELLSPKSCAVLSHIIISAILLCVWDASQLFTSEKSISLYTLELGWGQSE